VKVLITTGIFPPEIGGPATYVPTIAEALARHGHIIGVIAPQKRGVQSPIQDPSYRLIRFPHAHTLRYVNFLIEFWRAFASILNEIHAYELLYVNGLDLPAALASILTNRPMVMKIVGDYAWELAHSRRLTSHNLEEFQNQHSFRTGLLKVIYHAAPKHSQAVIVPSRYLAGIVAGWGVKHEVIHVVYNALSQPPKPATLNLPDGFNQGFRLLMVGRMIPLKRMEQVIGILPNLGDTRLVIVGDGPLHPQLTKLIDELGLAQRVLLIGQLSHSEVWALMTQYADVLVLNSIHETFPHVLLEAAQCGLPVVATSTGGTTEIVVEGETGLLIPPDSPDQLLVALQRLRTDVDLRQKLSRNARLVAHRFTYDRMVEETELVLQGAV
jgi:glycosyltransferase involved in cell wall biosynthesis